MKSPELLDYERKGSRPARVERPRVRVPRHFRKVLMVWLVSGWFAADGFAPAWIVWFPATIAIVVYVVMWVMSLRPGGGREFTEG